MKQDMRPIQEIGANREMKTKGRCRRLALKGYPDDAGECLLSKKADVTADISFR